MIFVKHHNDGKVYYVNYQPFDEKNGLGKTYQELELDGKIFDSLPELDNTRGTASLKVNLSDGTLFYEYSEGPAPISLDIVEELEKIKQDNKTLAEYIEEHEAALIELMEMMLGGME